MTVLHKWRIAFRSGITRDVTAVSYDEAWAIAERRYPDLLPVRGVWRIATRPEREVTK